MTNEEIKIYKHIPDKESKEEFIPPFPQLLYFCLVSAVAIFVSGILAGALKRYAGWKTGYTRKTLHFLIFFYRCRTPHLGRNAGFSNPWPAKRIILVEVILSSFLI